MTKNNLPIPRPKQTGALSLKRANQLLDITDKILTRSRQELALQNEAWMARLWAWAKENGVPDYEWIDDIGVDDKDDYVEGYWQGMPQQRNALLELAELQLAGMHLASLSPEIGQLTKLQSLFLGNNQLASLPAEISQLQQLQTLFLSGNSFTSLPPEIGQLQQLKYINIDQEHLHLLPPALLLKEDLEIEDEAWNLISMEDRRRYETKFKSKAERAPVQVAKPTPQQSLNHYQSGQIFKDGPDCPEMVMIPAGSFIMGSPDSEPGRFANEGLQHRVNIRAFAMGKTAVTFAQWDACVADGGCNGYRPDDRGWGRGDRPVIKVSWDDAQAYIAWLNRKTDQRYRLPSEAEWEYATRAGTTTRFSTGDCLSTDQANYNGDYPPEGCAEGEYRGKTLPVASFAANPFGLYDMHGNVLEWVEDCWNDSYNGAPTDGSAWSSGNCRRRAVRGGSWFYGGFGARSAFRYGSTRGDRSNNHGFRLSRSVF
jgi:formylglycine-generating enzyme required for sulfatase activity